VQITLAVLALSDVTLAAAVFVLFARPEAALGILARVTGAQEAWREGRLSEADEEELLVLARGIRWPMLLAVFGWSFVFGAVLVWARL
jgi:hypothetical protein